MHTKGKWKHTISGAEHRIVLDSDPFMTIARCGCGSEDEANAKHIVHCVNTHDELVEACEGLIKAIQYARKISLRDESPRGSIWGEARSLLDVARHKAEQAILKAKGGA